jgi:Heterokaryon incompatibility protein (HET)
MSEAQKEIARSSREHDHAVKSGEQLYFPLPEGRYTRLLELAPGVQMDPIVVSMFVVALNEAPDYAALSYVWGAPGATMSIVCNGIRIVITVNLGAALQRVRHSDRPRILWADAICIDQTNTHERGYHVGFMGKIYEHAKTVLVYLGPDLDGGAKDVAALVEENANLVSKYFSVEKMPILSQDDPLFDDPRWRSLATMNNCVWFTRAWVVQEVGLASNPRALYGDIEFSYKGLITLAAWHTRCASYLTPRHNVDFTAIHVEWLDWKLEVQVPNETQDRTFLDLLNHARWLACMDPRDHVYAFLGHPLAQREHDNGAIVNPNYSKHFEITYLELALQLIKQGHGFRLLCTVEHDDKTIGEDFPSWVPRWNVEQVMCTLGINSSFYYYACNGIRFSPLINVNSNLLEVRGAFLDVVSKAAPFSALDLTEPMTLLKEQPKSVSQGTLAHIWTELQEGISSSPQSSEACLNALSLTLTAGLSGPNPAEENLSQHRDNFAAYSLLTPNPTFIKAVLGFTEAASRGDPHRYWLDIRQACEGRSFCFTKNEHFALGPCVTEPRDLFYIIFGAKVPFILRKTEEPSQYKLVGEAYVHGFMRGEAMQMLRDSEIYEETIILC